MRGVELEQKSGDNTNCDIEIGLVPSCAKCCILRKARGAWVPVSDSLHRVYFRPLDRGLAAKVLLSRQHEIARRWVDEIQ